MENRSEEIGNEENFEGESHAGDEGESKKEIEKMLTFGSDDLQIVDSNTGFGIFVGGEDEVSDEDPFREEEKDYYREEKGDEESEEKEEDKIFPEVKEVEEYDEDYDDKKEGDCEEEEDEAEEEEELEEEEEEEKETMDFVYSSVEPGKERTTRIKSENDLSKIPSEIYGDRNLMESMLRDLSKERPSILLRNKYLEYKCSKHLNSTRGAAFVSSSIETNTGFEEEEEAERERYIRFLSGYKKESDENRIRNESIKESVDYLRDELTALVATDADVFADLISIQTSLGVDLVFEKTGRKLSVKRIEEMIRRQRSRRDQVARARLSFIRLWHKYEDIDSKIRKFETLGPGMRISDYEAELGVNLISKTRIDERNKALQKARERICGIMAAITHGKVKLYHLNDEIVFKKENLDRIAKCVHARRETLSAMRGELTITRNQSLNKRETAGLMLSLPTLRAIEDMIELHAEWKNRVEDLRSVQSPETAIKIKMKKRC